MRNFLLIVILIFAVLFVFGALKKTRPSFPPPTPPPPPTAPMPSPEPSPTPSPQPTTPTPALPIPTPTPTPPASTLDWIRAEGSLLKDSFGRTVVPRGFVLVTHFDTGRDELKYTQADYARMKAVGANYQSIRIFAGWIGAWPGFQPAQGYLEKLDSMVLAGKQNGMHSSFKLTLYDLPGMFDFTSSQREETWGDFWRNKNGEQDALVAAWKSIWEHYKNEPAVIGYDLLNEPEIGDLGVSAQVFEREYLIPFYRKAIDELRKIDTRHVALFQPGFGKVDVKTGNIMFHASETSMQRTNVVYAPHFYVNFVNKQGTYFPERYKPLLDRYINEARMHNAPVLFGEMGEFWTQENDGNSAKEARFRDVEDQQIDLFDQAMAGFSLPVYANDRSIAKGHNVLKGTSKSLSQSAERTIITDAMARPYPQSTAGALSSFQYVAPSKAFSMIYTPDSSLRETKIFIPARHYGNGFVVTHSSGISLQGSPSSSSLNVASNPGGIDATKFSWDKTSQILAIAEWQKGVSVTLDIEP